MNQLAFFQEAIFQLTSSQNPEVGIGHLFRLLQQKIPLDTVLLQIYDPGLSTMRILRVRTQSDIFKMDKVVPLHANELGDWKTWLREGSVRRIDQASKDLFMVRLLETLGMKIGASDKSCLIVQLHAEQTVTGNICLMADGLSRYTDGHVEIVKMLANPIAIVTHLYLSLQKQIKMTKSVIEENRFLSNELRSVAGEDIIGADSGLKDVIQMVEHLANVDTPILITGETGVGKELIANLIQKTSSRRQGPFVKVNCGAIPDSLIDSELFGHERGAFTGAVARKIGRFERADGGTIFLDEIGELPLQAQTRLLRVLQNQNVERVGGVESIPIDTRVIAATHRDLPKMIQAETFREDLYFRLNVFPINVPPLRYHKQDIPALVHHFIHKKANIMNLPVVPSLAPGAVDPLLAYDWPGNVRELENIIERAIILYRDTPIRFDFLLPSMSSCVCTTTDEIKPLDVVVRQHILSVLKVARGKISGPGGAAELLGVHPNTLRKRMDKIGICYKKRR